MLFRKMMRIAIFATNTKLQYSGGRYHSWLMAEALSHAGYEVYYVTNNKPMFYDDFSDYPRHENIRLLVSKFFCFNLPEGDFDIVVLVPSLNMSPTFYLQVLGFCASRRARLVLLNFETPNWYNQLSPVKRDPSLWDSWRYCGYYASLILSSTQESNKFAKRYFSDVGDDTQFDCCYPSINSIVADSVAETRREKRIIVFARFMSAEHKGGVNISDLVCDEMRGYTLVLLIGVGEIPVEVLKKIRDSARECGVHIEVKNRLSDHEKFFEIKRSSLMLFPSFFEGFGLPPVEALYCDTPCIAFDLPVLREVNDDSLVYVEPGNWSQFRNKIREALSDPLTSEDLKGSIEPIACFENYVHRIQKIISQVLERDSGVCYSSRPSAYALKFYLRLIMLLPYRVLLWICVVSRDNFSKSSQPPLEERSYR